VERRNNIRLKQAANVVKWHLLERRRKRKAGAVDHNVDAAMLGVDFVDESCGGSLVGDVERAGL
jgi:hypothetical protein